MIAPVRNTQKPLRACSTSLQYSGIRMKLRANTRKNSQHCWANNVRSCCVRSQQHATTCNRQGVQTDATSLYSVTSNNVGSSVLAHYIASLCTGLKEINCRNHLVWYSMHYFQCLKVYLKQTIAMYGRVQMVRKIICGNMFACIFGPSGQCLSLCHRQSKSPIRVP